MDNTKFLLAFAGFMLVEFWVILGIVLSSKKTDLDKKEKILVMRPTYFELFCYVAFFYVSGSIITVLIGFVFYQLLVFNFLVSSIIIWIIMFRSITTLYVFKDSIVINKHLMKHTETISIVNIKEVFEVIGNKHHYFSLRYFCVTDNRIEALAFLPDSIRDMDKFRAHLQANNIPFKVIDRSWPYN